MRTLIQSLAPLRGLRILHCCELWYRSQLWLGSGIAVAVAVALAQEFPYAAGAALKKKKKKNDFRVMIIKTIQDLGKKWKHRLVRYKKCVTQS